ncbi:MAG: hypothetical protein J1F61_06485 [Clostridiales bacterium]|nr:hypothetical protein [Clostridiales bacterium]
MKNIDYKYYRNKYVDEEPSFPRDKHATISVISHKKNELAVIDEYLKDCEQRFDVEYIKPMSSVEQAWEEVMKSTNATFNNRGKNIVLECMQFGGNREFWNSFDSEQEIKDYFRACYKYVEWKIGFLHTHENIICAAIITEPNRRNLFVYYLPVTKKWLRKVLSDDESEADNRLQQRNEEGMPMYWHRVEIDEPLLSHSEFWKARGGLTSYSDLQEDFYVKVSKQYGAKRGKSYSLVKNTTLRQQERYGRFEGDKYDELYYDDLPF